MYTEEFKKGIVLLRSNPIAPDPRVEKECYSLAKAGFYIRILAWDRGDKYLLKEEYIRIFDQLILVYRFGIKAKFGGGIKANFFPLLEFQVKIFQWLFFHRKEYKVIHACDFDTAIIGFLCALIFRKKFVYDIFDYYVDAFFLPEFCKYFIKKIDDYIISQADWIIICTEERKKQINVDSDVKKVKVIHNSPILDERLEGNVYNNDRDRIRIVYVGILQEGRFIRELIEVIKSRTDCELHIAGFGKLMEYVKKSSGEYQNIKFYGKISYRDALKLEKYCDIMTALYDPLIANHKYAAPNKFYEALMLGKPLIMIKNTGMDTIVSQYDIGKVIQFSKTALEKAIDELIQEKNDWPIMKKRMRNIYDEQFSWKIMEKRLIDMYSELFDSN